MLKELEDLKLLIADLDELERRRFMNRVWETLVDIEMERTMTFQERIAYYKTGRELRRNK